MPRAQKIAVFSLLAAALALAAVILLTPRPQRTGTNSVPHNAFIDTVQPGGERACVKGLALPAETAGIRVMVGTYELPDLDISFVISDAGGRQLRRSELSGIDDGATPIFTFAEFPRAVKGLRGCFESDGGKVAFAGDPNGNTDPVTSFFIGERPAKGDIALEFMYAGERSSLSLIPEMARRATLYRPGWYGEWSFYLAFALTLAALAGGVALLLRLGARREWGTRQTLVLGALVFVGCTGWALITPPFSVPDEAAHYVYTETLARGDLPDKTQAPGSRGDAYLTSTVVTINATTDNVIQKPDLPISWDRAREARALADFKALRAGPDTPFGLTPAKDYSPLYYAPAALAYKLTPGDTYSKLFSMRLYSALLAALAAMLAVAFARELLPSVDWFAPVAGLAVAFTPMFLHVGGGVSNDGMLVLFSTATLLFTARMLRGGATPKLSAAIGVSLGLGYMAKPTIAGIAPAVAFAFLLVAWRERRQLGPAVRRLAPGLLAFIAIFVAAGLLFGSSSTTAGSLASPVRQSPFTLGGLISHTWQWYLPAPPGVYDFFPGMPPFVDVFVKGFFANFNALDTYFDQWLYYVIALIGALLTAGAALAVYHRRDRLTERWPLVAMPAIAVAGMALFINLTTFLILTKDGTSFAQGRYLFPVIGVFGALVSAGSLGAGRRRGLVIASLVVTALALLNLFGLGLSASRFYL